MNLCWKDAVNEFPPIGRLILVCHRSGFMVNHMLGRLRFGEWGGPVGIYDFYLEKDGCYPSTSGISDSVIEDFQCQKWVLFEDVLNAIMGGDGAVWTELLPYDPIENRAEIIDIGDTK